ncbi:60S ribosomal protein L13a-1 [Vitis vinifera]|uniref:60S ribosomal protein L13a-1 n=1 Tax=Vitis vinifera TaxID=29760 RepID=A0A438IMT1_VITVI|nr:60S ribosomal protein L13a-1 [Vitis vinifera]
MVSGSGDSAPGEWWWTQGTTCWGDWQDEVPEVPPQAHEHQALSWAHPLPRPLQDPLAYHPWGFLRLQAGHKYCLLGRLSSEVGWNHYDTIRELEKKRKERAQLAYERKKQLTKLRVKAEKVAEEKLSTN